MRWLNAYARTGWKVGLGASLLRSDTTYAFWELYYSLPKVVQQRARKAYALFEKNPQHPSLNFKPVRSAHSPIYSARVGRNYRVLGLLEHDLITWFWIGPHTDYDRILEGM